MTVTTPSILRSKPISWNLAKWGKGKCAPAPEYVVVHFTGGVVDNPTTVYDAFRRRKSNCHYIVSSKGIYECVDPEKYACLFACAAKYATADLDKFAGTQAASHIRLAGNHNTINLECCSEKRTKRCAYAVNYIDSDWYFSDRTYRNMVELTAWLLDKFGLGMDRLIMHHHISGKLCPAMWCNSEDAYSGWTAFKTDVATVLNKGVSASELGAPTGPGSYAATFMPGTIYVNKGDPVYLYPGGMVVGFIPQDMSIEYTYADGGYFYTMYGYVRNGL